ncbi:MAG: redoxin domain-containing protein [Gemmatimonadota bacterium]
MRAYRDQYASVFKGGRNVVLIGISNDPIEEGRSWLADEDFPFAFASDPTGGTYAAYGGSLRDEGMVGGRSVIVVGPDGVIAGVMPQFNQVDPLAYEELAGYIDEVTPEPEDP